MTKARYAIYFSPKAKSPLWRFGARWLGRDTTVGDEFKQPVMKNLSAERIAEMTSAPRVYGFHATLKPPFRLASNRDREMLDTALEAFAAVQTPFMVPALELADLDGFIALRPEKKCPQLDEFAAACVREFDTFRAPPTRAETGRRLKANLTDQQKMMLAQWGYPFVMDEYRFHMTLTERLKDQERRAVLSALENLATDMPAFKTWNFDTITLVRQDAVNGPFQVMKRYSLKRPAPRQ